MCEDVVNTFLQNLLAINNFAHDAQLEYNIVYLQQLQTYIGSVVISVNPYQPLNLYTPDHIFHYKGKNQFELKYVLPSTCFFVLSRLYL